MKLSKSERVFLTTFVGIAQKILDTRNGQAKKASDKRRRRSAAEVADLRKQVRVARKQKIPAPQIAKKIGVTTSYIYQLER